MSFNGWSRRLCFTRMLKASAAASIDTQDICRQWRRAARNARVAKRAEDLAGIMSTLTILRAWYACTRKERMLRVKISGVRLGGRDRFCQVWKSWRLYARTVRILEKGDLIRKGYDVWVRWKDYVGMLGKAKVSVRRIERDISMETWDVWCLAVRGERKMRKFHQEMLRFLAANRLALLYK